MGSQYARGDWYDYHCGQLRLMKFKLAEVLELVPWSEQVWNAVRIYCGDDGSAGLGKLAQGL